MKNLIIEVDNEKFFVGDLAIRQSELMQSTISEKRIESIENKVLFLTGFALLDGVGTGVSKFNLVTGLPVDEYLQFKELLTEKLIKDHVIRLIDGTKNDNKLIQIKRCKVIPQPFGTLFNMLLDDYGNIQDKELVGLNIGVIDIGFRTSDYAVANKLEFVDRLSSSSTTALSTAYRIIGRKLKEAYDINKPIHQLEDMIRNRSFTYNGKDIDITDLVNKAFSLTAGNIVSEINTLWPDIWEMDKIFITGGGGLALGDYFKKYLDNYIVVPGGQFSNVEGYQKVCNRSFKRVIE
ncbi:MAG: ParM/StbA family protein [Firmicutes bacterium]|nr:ParM/StbA family protein [Bacillota bacterium]